LQKEDGYTDSLPLFTAIGDALTDAKISHVGFTKNLSISRRVY